MSDRSNCAAAGHGDDRVGLVRAGVDEFLRAYLTPRGRVAFYAAARQIYLEEPHGSKGFWTLARHLVLDCGHVPQIERPAETHAAIAAFLRERLRRPETAVVPASAN